MTTQELIIRLAGEGGEGVISAGDIFTAGAARTGYHTFTFRTYPSEIKGGHAWYQIRIGSHPILSMGDGIDLLVAWDAEAYYNHCQDLNPNGVLIYDPDAVAPEEGRFLRYPVPFNKIAKQELGFFRGKNIVVLGILAALLGLEPSALENWVRSRFARRAELLAQNLKALDRGYQYAKENLSKADPYYLSGGDKQQRAVLSGNEAIVAGALAAGCRFFAGYPITPASDIMESMARELPRYGGMFLQAEDEMAALGAALGASFAGAKAMTATSGPGMSLMTEILGLSAMAEIPVVVVDAQRSGPSSGMPTKLEQADLNHALYGGHGDFPRIVIAPTSVEDAFYQIIEAFNMAERYQLPVIFLSDQSLSQRTQTMTVPQPSQIRVVDRLRPDGFGENNYQRYAFTEDGIVPMAVPGVDRTTYVATGLEHDEAGHHTITPENHERMQEKRFRKLAKAAQELEAPPRYGVAEPEIAVIGWGSTEGPIVEAVGRAVAQGYKVGALHPRVLSPLPEKEMGDFLRSVRAVIVPEANYTGQFARLLRATFGIQPIPLPKFGGLPLMPKEILAKIEEVARS